MLNKDISNKKIYFDIQEKKEELIILKSIKVNKVILKLSYLLVLLDNEWIIYDLNVKTNKLVKILKSNHQIYKVFIDLKHLYLINKKIIIKYDYKNEFKILKEFKWNDDI